MSTKNPSNGTVKVTMCLISAVADGEFPTAAELNAGLELTDAIAWSDFEVAPSDSGDLDDRSLRDAGNAVSRGAAAYAGSLSLFRDKFNANTESIFVQAFEAFRVPFQKLWIFVRVNADSIPDFADGDMISAYKFIGGVPVDDTAGDDSVKSTVALLPQAELYCHTTVGTSGVISGVAATFSKTVAAGAFQLQPVLANGVSIVSRAAYSSSAPLICSVSNGGTAVPLTAGTATISVSYGAAAATLSTEVTVTA